MTGPPVRGKTKPMDPSIAEVGSTGKLSKPHAGFLAASSRVISGTYDSSRARCVCAVHHTLVAGVHTTLGSQCDEPLDVSSPGVDGDHGVRGVHDDAGGESHILSAL